MLVTWIISTARSTDGIGLLPIALLILFLAGPVPGISTQAANADPAVLRLLPYRLAAGDLPAGYSISDESAAPNATVAFQDSTDPRALLQRLVTSGRITGMQQTFVRDESTPVRLAIALYSDAAAAVAAVQTASPPGATDDVSDLEAPPLGDGARMAQGAASGPDGSNVESWLVTWSRGPLVFGVTLSGDIAADLGADGVPLAQLVDAHAAAVGWLPEPAPDLVLPADGRELALARALAAAQLPDSAAPPGYAPTGGYLYSNDQIVLDSDDPPAAAGRLAAWGRLSGQVRYFTTGDNRRAVLSSVLSVFATPEGARSALTGAPPRLARAQSVKQISPEARLGDDAMETVSSLVWLDGAQRDEYRLEWRHGPVVLAVVVNVPAGETAPDFLAATATALDAAYLARPLAGS